MFTQPDNSAAFMLPKLKDQLTITDLWVDTALWVWGDWQKLQRELMQRPRRSAGDGGQKQASPR